MITQSYMKIIKTILYYKHTRIFRFLLLFTKQINIPLKTQFPKDPVDIPTFNLRNED